MMSHELRTPLNAISGYVDLMSLGVDGPLTEKQTASLSRIQLNQQHLLSLIDDVLSFAENRSRQAQRRNRDGARSRRVGYSESRSSAELEEGTHVLVRALRSHADSAGRSREATTDSPQLPRKRNEVYAARAAGSGSALTVRNSSGYG